MATQASYVGNGTTVTFAVPFAYRDDGADLFVTVDGAAASFTLDNASTVRLTTAPTSGAIVRVFRRTPFNAPAVVFEDDAVLSAADLNLANEQLFNKLEETSDAGADIERRALLVPAGTVAPPTADLTGQNGVVLGIVDGSVVPVPNGAAEFAQDVADAQAALEAAAAAAQAEIAQDVSDAGEAATAAGLSAAAAATHADTAGTHAATADAARIAAEAAEAEVTAMRAAILAALVGSNVFTAATLNAAKTAGLAAVAEGGTFAASGADVDYIGVFKDVAGVATEVFRFPTLAAFEAAAAEAQEAAVAVFERARGDGQSNVMIDGGETADKLQRRATSWFSRTRNALMAASFLTPPEERMRRVVVCWGHSGFEGSGSSFSPNPDPYENATSGQTAAFCGRLKAELGEDWRVYNMGIGAQGAQAIAARMGAIPTVVTVAGGSIPATGAVNCTLSTAWLENAGGRGFSIPATINGVPVLIKAPTANGTNPQHTVEQLPGAVDALVVSAGSLIVPSLGDLDYAINLFYIDRNGQDINKMRYLTGQMAAKVKGKRRFVFFGTWNWRNSGRETVGTAGFITSEAINDEYRRMWPENFFDKRRFLRGDWPYDGTAEKSAFQIMGLTATPQDVIDIADGLEPTTFSSNDNSHNNDAGQAAMARFVARELFARKGWLND